MYVCCLFAIIKIMKYKSYYIVEIDTKIYMGVVETDIYYEIRNPRVGFGHLA